jgi:hypothetical protein
VQVTGISAASNIFIFFTNFRCIDSQAPYIATHVRLKSERGFGSEASWSARRGVTFGFTAGRGQDGRESGGCGTRFAKSLQAGN